MNKKYLVTTNEMQNEIALNQYNICQEMKKTIYIDIYLFIICSEQFTTS